MNGRGRPHLNLASQPFRNRRFYFAGLVSLGVLGGLAVSLLGLWFVQRTASAAADRKAVAAAEERLAATERSRADVLRRTAALQTEDRELVAQTNAAIARKAFSYVEFFALLEEALPARAYITSLSPVSAREGRVAARLKVVTAGLEDLMSLLTKLEALKFKDLAIIGETQAGGQLIAEVGLAYEKTF
ncbi:MAG: hypothetical protein FJY80_10760 [Candidatus Aminicenantes bacterium]|nr:hypothetical protein [Candidatus Aminicenantes bacterium]